MNLEPIKKTASLAPDTLAQYVSDVADTEAAIFTLKQAEAQLETKMKHFYDSFHKSIKEKKQECDSLKEALEHHEKTKMTPVEYARENGKYPDGIGDLLPKCFYGLILVLFISVPLYLILAIIYYFSSGGKFSDIFSDFSYTAPFSNHLFLIALFSLIGIAFLSIFYYIFRDFFATNRDYRDCITIGYNVYLTEHENERNTRKENLKKEKQELWNREKQLESAKSGYAVLGAQLAHTRAKREELERQKKKLYAVNIIPPDYRFMDCVLVFDFIFRNGLADTMREAVANYEERVFRGEVIKGMDSILRSIHNLAAGMSMIVTRLDTINRTVSMLSSDLFRYSESVIAQQKSNQAATERLIEETKLGRYATEELHRTTERIAYYNGLLP